MMIRIATHSDIDSIIPLLTCFVNGTGYPVPFDEDSARNSLESYIDCDNKVVIVCDTPPIVGVILGFVSPLAFNEHIKVAQEIGWYINPDARSNECGSQLLRSFEEWASQHNAVLVHMVTIVGPHRKRLSRFYKKSGYRPLEYAFIKELRR